MDIGGHSWSVGVVLNLQIWYHKFHPACEGALEKSVISHLGRCVYMIHILYFMLYIFLLFRSLIDLWRGKVELSTTRGRRIEGCCLRGQKMTKGDDRSKTGLN